MGGGHYKTIVIVMLILLLRKVIWLSLFLWLLQASILYLIVPESSYLECICIQF